MSSGREMAADYRTTLSELTCNNKTQINMLTILAEDYKDFAPFIVNVIEDELLTSPPQRKIVILYVIDSIVKNIPKAGDYRAHFSKNIAKIFKHVFEESEERTRASLYKLRQTWADIFPRGKLYDIDVRINMIDNAWPVASISRPAAAAATTTTNARINAAANQTVHVNPKFLNQNEVARRVVVKNEPVPTTLSSSNTDVTTKNEGEKNGPSSLPLKSALKKPKSVSPVVDAVVKPLANGNRANVATVESPSKEKKEKGQRVTKVAPNPTTQASSPSNKRSYSKTAEKPPKDIVDASPKAATKVIARAKTVTKAVKAPSAEKVVKKEVEDVEMEELSSTAVVIVREDVSSSPASSSPSIESVASLKSENQKPQQQLKKSVEKELKVEVEAEKEEPPEKKPALSTYRNNSASSQGHHLQRQTGGGRQRNQQQQSGQFNKAGNAGGGYHHNQHHHQPQQQQQTQHQKHFGFRKQSPPHSIQPTVALGSHAFITPQTSATPVPLSSVTFTSSQTTNSPAINAIPPPTLPQNSTLLPVQQHQQPDFKPLSSQMPGRNSPSGMEFKPPQFIPPPRQQPIHHPVTMSQPPPNIPPSSGFFHPPPMVNNSGPPSMLVPPLMPSAATISNETPRLQGMPANNRVFVDGKAYDVIFLCDVPVIVRNGLPHRVSFSGPPRDIMIDGILHKLAFGEAKTVMIDGEPHVLRFGAPSRELYMGNFPFRGVFGGPPIVATINGRRHEIRLLGAPPEAKIEQDPSYELARYMDPSQTNSALSSMGAQPAPIIRQEPPKKETSVSNLEVSTLLKKLQHSGILSALTSQKKQASDAAKPPQPSTSADIRNSNSPPIPSTQRLDNIERRTAPMSALDQFSMRSLVVRYDSVIDALHKDRVECPSCGIAIKELYGEAYHQHTAWHMRVLKGEKYTRSRPWFMSEEWFTFSETELANRVAAAEGEKTTDDQVASSSGVISGDALSGDADEKDCCVCNEKFEEYFDEDDDAWKLRDCVIEDGKAFHRYCKTDAAFLDQSTSGANNANSTETDDGIGSGFEETSNRDEQQPKNLFGNLCDVNDTVELKAFIAGNIMNRILSGATGISLATCGRRLLGSAAAETVIPDKSPASIASKLPTSSNGHFVRYDEFPMAYPDFLPSPVMDRRDPLFEELVHADMLERRVVISIPEFYVGSIMAVTTADPNLGNRQNRFIGICINRHKQGLHHNFTLRNVIDGLGVEVMYELYNPTILKIETVKLEKRLDDDLSYLIDALPEYSTVNPEMDPITHPVGTPVPTNPVKVIMRPPPWRMRWALYDFKGIEDTWTQTTPWFKRKMSRKTKVTEFSKYDVIMHYRDDCQEYERDLLVQERMAKFEEARHKEGVTKRRILRMASAPPQK